MRAGSILVDVRGSVADLAAAVKDVRDNGLELPSFDALTAKPGMCVYRIGESCYHSLNTHLCLLAIQIICPVLAASTATAMSTPHPQPRVHPPLGVCSHGAINNKF